MDWNQENRILKITSSMFVCLCSLLFLCRSGLSLYSFRSDENLQLPLATPCCPVDLKLSHVDCNPGDTLVHFQGQYVTTCELDYNILQVEIQNAEKKKAPVAVGERCLVEDVLSSRWYRGRVQNQQGDLSDVFLLDYGNVLTVSSDCLAVFSDALLSLPPRIVCGFFANVLPVQECWNSMAQTYFGSLIGTQIKGYVHALLPYKVLLLEVPEIAKDLLALNLGRCMDTATFMLLVKMLLEAPIQQISQSVSVLLNEKQTTQECPFRSSTLSGFENIISLSGSKLAVGQQERVKVSAAVNPGLFYCQLSSTAKDLKEMSEKLASACELRSRDCGDTAAENLGLLCAVKGKDGRWHRGFVQCLPLNSDVRVVFVDYGYCESVKVEDVLQLPLDFLRTPIMAYPCSLSCLTDTDKDRESQQMVILRSALLGKELAFKVDGFSKAKNVFLVTLSSADEFTQANTVNSDELAETCIPKSKQIFSSPKWCNDTSKEVKTLNDSLPFEDLQEGSEFKGYVEYVQNPNNFWIRAGESNDRFENMMNNLSNYFSSVQLNEEILDDLVPGVLCCAMYEQDMHYYRARVVETLENGAQVFFIDFGNIEKVPSMLIKKLPSDFAEEPQFVFNCSLAHIAPLDDCWTVEATDYFRKATSNKEIVVHVLNKRNDSFVVELYDQRAEKFESITTLMTKAKMAESWKCILTSEPAQGKNHTNICKRVSQNLDSKGTTKEVVVDRKALTETPESKAIVVERFRYRKITPGSELSVLCSHVTSPSNFWCQNKKQKEDLDRLMEKLQDFYRTHTPVLQAHSMCCAIKIQEDNRWYRGCTIGFKNEEAQVVLIDYGIVVKESLQNICALMPEFIELGAQAFRCSLYNLIEPVEKNVWSKEACTLLKEFVSGNSSNLTCKIYSQFFVTNEGLYNVVDLQTPLQWASSYLVQKRVAMETKCPKQLVPSAYPYSFVYSSFNICVGSEELVYATHVVSPWEIYLQLDRNSAIIDELMERVTKECEELLRRRNGDARVGVGLAKYFGDSRWYRSIAWLAQSSQHLNVFFVDYGNKQVVEKSNVLPIPMKAVDLLLIPMQALRCRLLNVSDEEHLPEVNAWLKQTIINKALTAKFVAKDESGNFICDLFDGNMHINEKMNDLFANLRQKDAFFSRKPSNDCCKEGKNLSSSSCKSKNAERCQVGTTVNLHKTSDSRKVTQGNSQTYHKKSPRCKNNLKGSLSKENQNRDIHKLQHKGQAREGVQKREKGQTPCTLRGRTSRVLPKASDLPDLRMKPGFRGVGFISHCHSPDRFFIQMKYDEQTILKIGKELNNSSFTANLNDVTSEVNIGDLVAARYEEDQALYRAVVTSVVSSDTLRVQFIDYGNSSTVDRKDIHLLTSQFLSHTRLSIPCLLSKPCGFQDSESFIKETHDKPLNVEFVKNLGYAWEVCIKISDSLQELRTHCADDGEIEKVPSSTLCRPYNSEINKAEKSSLEENTKEMNEVVQQKCLGTKKEMRISVKNMKKKTKCKKCYKGQYGTKQNGSLVKLYAPNHVRYLEKRTPINSELNVSHDDGIFDTNILETSINLPESIDVRVKECLSEKPTLVDTSLDNYTGKNDQVHLVLAPVQVDFEYSGFAAAVTTPSEFNIVLEDLLLMMNTVSNILEDLPDVLPPLPETHLISGTSCLVKSGEKNKWCRAEIVQFNDISLVINLVDYGHYAHFPSQEVDKLKRLPRELAVLPKITYPCLLRGVKPAADIQWSDNAVVFFQECMCQKGLQIYFRDYVSEAQWEVDVFTGGRNVAKELVDAGHASYIDSVLGIVSSIMDNVPEAPETNSDRHTQLIKEELLQGNLEEVSSADDSFGSNDKMPPHCDRQGRTGNNFSKNCDLGLGQKTCHGSSSGFRKCMLM